ncbi:MAG: sugar transferase [Chroococcidiopsidaceae cyanobacterium CP_BM_ER_R8_30]|nr:sugar transferase [Chroococcidiopsidaceae cyanobacterium CP_BM_ER_R8_30]
MIFSIFLNPRLDLREPVFTRLRKRVYAGSFRVITLVLMDITFLFLAWQVAATYGTPINSYWNTESNPLSLFPILAIEIGLIAVQGLYKSGEKRRDYLSLIQTLTFANILLLLISFFYQPNRFVSRLIFILSWLLSIIFTCFGRFCLDFTVRYIHKQGIGRSSIFLICHSKEIEKVIELLGQDNCYNIAGYYDIASLNSSEIEVVVEKIYKLGVSEVFVCSWCSIKNRILLYWSLRNTGIALYILPDSLEKTYRNYELNIVCGQPFIRFSSPIITGSDFRIKQCFDVVISALLLLVTAPILLSIALLIKLDSPGPVFYKQNRVGLHGKQFKVWKFRTMVANADKLQKELEALNEMKDGVLFKIKSDPRITKVGRFLRRYSLDELPQLFNVLFREMSLVGPRPLPLRDVSNFANDHYFIRHEVLPGITGLWQVSGRSDITSFEQVMRLDMFYVENWSLQLDLQILIQTIVVLFSKKGAY